MLALDPKKVHRPYAIRRPSHRLLSHPLPEDDDSGCGTHNGTCLQLTTSNSAFKTVCAVPTSKLWVKSWYVAEVA